MTTKTNDIKTRINKALETGYTQDQVYDRLKSSESYGPKITEALNAGYSEQDVFNKLFPDRKSYNLPGAESSYSQEFETLQNIKDPNRGFFQTAADLYSLSDEDIAPRAISPQQAKVSGKSALSGATIGISENIPGLDISREERRDMPGTVEGSKIAGAILPMELLMNLYGRAGAYGLSKVPNAPKAIKSFVDLASVGGAGATYGGIEHLTETGEMPSVGDVAEHGAIWMGIDAAMKTLGLGGRFASALYKMARGNGTTPTREITNLANRVKSGKVDVNKPADLAEFIFKEMGEPLEADAIKSAKEVKPEGAEQVSKAEQALRAGEQDILKAEQALEKGVEAPQPKQSIELRPEPQPAETKPLQGRVSKVESRPPESLNKPAMQKVAKEVEDYAPVHPDKKTYGEAVQGFVKDAQKEAKETYDPLYEIAKKASSQTVYSPSKSIELANKALDDIQALKTRPRGYKEAEKVLTDALEDMGAETEGLKSVKDLVELSKRIAEFADYKALEPSIKDIYRRLAKSLKEEAKRAIKSNKQAYKAFQKAEKTYGDFANKLNRDVIEKIRLQQSTEKIADLVKSPTALKDLKDVLSKKAFKQIERQYLEQLSDMPIDQAKKLFKETRGQLTKQGQQLAEKVIKQRELGEFVDSLFKDGYLDFAKASEAMSNPNIRIMIEDVGGKEAITFFKNVEKTQAKIEADAMAKATQEKIAEPIGPKGAKERKEAIKSREAKGKSKLEDIKSMQEAKKAELVANQKQALEAKKVLEQDLLNAKGDAKAKKQAFDSYNAKMKERMSQDFVKPEAGEPAKPRVSSKGKEKIARTKAMNEPYKIRVGEWIESMGLGKDAVLVGKLMLGVMMPKPAAALIAGKAIYSMARRPAVRKAYFRLMNELGKKGIQYNRNAVIEAIESLSSVIMSDKDAD